MTEVIRPCPICGSPPDVGPVEPWPKDAGPPPWYAGCYQGGGNEHFVGANGDTREDVIARWNAAETRPTEGRR